MHVTNFQNHLIDTTNPKNLQKPGDAQVKERHYTALQLNTNFVTMLTPVSPNRLTEYTLPNVLTHPEIPPYYERHLNRSGSELRYRNHRPIT